LTKRSNAKKKKDKYEKQHQRHIIHGTYNPITVMHETHGQHKQLSNVVELKMVP
jgi:hypothetical protein